MGTLTSVLLLVVGLIVVLKFKPSGTNSTAGSNTTNTNPAANAQGSENTAKNDIGETIVKGVSEIAAAAAKAIFDSMKEDKK